MSPFLIINTESEAYVWMFRLGPLLVYVDASGHIHIVGPDPGPDSVAATFNTASSLAQSALQFEDEELKQIALGFAREMVKLGCEQAASFVKTV